MDWPLEVEQLADHLGLGSFAVMGWSAGGMYAQACAARLTDRVCRLGLIASAILASGRDSRRSTAWTGPDAAVRRGSGGERLMFWSLRLGAQISPATVAKQSGAPEEVAACMGDAIAAALVDTRWAVQEYRLLNTPWAFDPAMIRPPRPPSGRARRTSLSQPAGRSGSPPRSPGQNSAPGRRRRPFPVVRPLGPDSGFADARPGLNRALSSPPPRWLAPQCLS